MEVIKDFKSKDGCKIEKLPNTASRTITGIGMHTSPGVVGCFAARFQAACVAAKLVPAKWRCLVPGERRDGAQSSPCYATGNASR